MYKIAALLICTLSMGACATMPCAPQTCLPEQLDTESRLELQLPTYYQIFGRHWVGKVTVEDK